MPPKKPLALILGNNNIAHLTKAEIEERLNSEVKAPSNKIEAPSYLPIPLQKKFNELAAELTSIDIMSNLDCEALARFIISEYQYQRVVKKAIKLSPENIKYMELLTMQEKLFKMARTAATDLGLTISSRCKLTIPKKDEKEKVSKWNKFGAVNNG